MAGHPSILVMTTLLWAGFLMATRQQSPLLTSTVNIGHVDRTIGFPSKDTTLIGNTTTVSYLSGKKHNTMKMLLEYEIYL